MLFFTVLGLGLAMDETGALDRLIGLLEGLEEEKPRVSRAEFHGGEVDCKIGYTRCHEHLCDIDPSCRGDQNCPHHSYSRWIVNGIGLCAYDPWMVDGPVGEAHTYHDSTTLYGKTCPPRPMEYIWPMQWYTSAPKGSEATYWPTEGCFIMLPKGCPNAPSFEKATGRWHKDAFASSHQSREACKRRVVGMGSSDDSYAKWCGVSDDPEDILWYFVKYDRSSWDAFQRSALDYSPEFGNAWGTCSYASMLKKWKNNNYRRDHKQATGYGYYAGTLRSSQRDYSIPPTGPHYWAQPDD